MWKLVFDSGQGSGDVLRRDDLMAGASEQPMEHGERGLVV